MALLQRLKEAPTGKRWIRSVAKTLLDGENQQTPTQELNPTATGYPSVEEAWQHSQQSALDTPSLQIRSDPIQLTQIRPDFESTAVGRLLREKGLQGHAFERFSERNPRAFHLTHSEVLEKTEALSEMLSLTDQQLLTLLQQYPRVLTLSTPSVDKILKFLTHRLQFESAVELQKLVISAPGVFDSGFEGRCDRALTLLFERFKLTLLDVKRICQHHPQFLTQIEENQLLKLAALLESMVRLSILQVGKLLKDAPGILSHSLFGLRERIFFLNHYQVTPSQVREMLMECPALLDSASTAEMRHVVNFLEAVLGAGSSVVRKIIVREPSVFKLDTELDMTPNLAALKNLGFSQHEISLMLVRCPKILTLKLASPENQLKIKFLRRELRKEPASLLTYPNYLAHSWKETLLPRIAFLKHLNRLDSKEWPLMKLFGESDEEFCTRHIKTVPERYTAFQKHWRETETTFLTTWAPELLKLQL